MKSLKKSLEWENHYFAFAEWCYLLCLEEELVEEVTCIIGKNEWRHFGKERKILDTALGFKCTLCSFRVFRDLCLVLQVSAEVVINKLYETLILSSFALG